MNGVLLVDKPTGWTSFDAVAKVRGIIRTANRQAMTEGEVAGLKGPATSLPKRVKVGHTGTLDPLATGLLVLLVGNYTKRAPELTKLDKTYQVIIKLGETSTTGDEEGAKTAVSNLRPTQEQLLKAVSRFIGDIMQTPPAFSAMKVGGVRAYKLARQGQKVALAARPVRINSLNVTRYQYPFIELTADVSSGTYIRSLVEDIGDTLGTGAYMTGLRRTRVGQFNLADAIPANTLSYAQISQAIQGL